MPRKSTKDTSQIQLNLETSKESKEANSGLLTSLLSDFRARICQLLENGQGLKVQEAVCSLKRHGLFGNVNPLFLSLRTSQGFLPVTTEKTLRSYCERLPTLGYMSVNGNCLILPGFCPKIESGYTLSDILQTEVDEKYFLSEKLQKSLMTDKAFKAMKPLGGGRYWQDNNGEVLENGKDGQLHQLIGGSQGYRVYDPDGISTTIAGEAGGVGTKTGLYCVAMRGRNPDNPSDRTTGGSTEQRLEPNTQGTTNAITSVCKDNLIVCK